MIRFSEFVQKAECIREVVTWGYKNTKEQPKKQPKDRPEREIPPPQSKTFGSGPGGREWSSLPPKPPGPEPNRKGGITFTAFAPEPKPVEAPKPPEPPVNPNRFPAATRRRLGLPVGGPIDLTHNGKPLNPAGKAWAARIRAAKHGPNRQIRLERGKYRTGQVSEFYQLYLNSIQEILE
jgi:hypothetical protein